MADGDMSLGLRKQAGTAFAVRSVAAIALAAACFAVYAVYDLVVVVGLRFGFAPERLALSSSPDPFLLLFLGFLVVSLFPFFLFVGWMTLFKHKRHVPKRLPFVTIVIPAFNEQATVGKSIECALAQDYPKFEVIVADDGSSDFTPYLIGGDEVRAIRLARNRGKAHAVNQAVAEAKGEYVLFSDSDSHLHPDAIRTLVGHFNDPAVGAVSGQLIVRKSPGIIVLWQTIEYIFSQAVVKVAQFGSAGSISVCPGPICMYRRSLLLSLEGFKNRTLVEDFDMTLETIRSGYRTVYEPDALAWTSTPKSFKALKSQRIRWYRGNLQAVKLHKDIFFNRKYGALGFFWFPYLLAWGFGGALLQIALIAGLPVVALSSDAPWEVSRFGVFLYLSFEAVSAVQYVFTLALDRKMTWRLVAAALAMKPYHLFLAYVHLVAMYREIRKARIVWNG
jgi:cellulose synthase/poly-beta-1,6-N-acetylglucosamine synthase-like glycosyltransferase